MSVTLGELSQISGAKLVGDPDCNINSINTLELAKPGDITFLTNRHYVHLLSVTNASAVILSEDDIADCPTNYLLSKSPYLAYAKIANYLYPSKQKKGYVDKTTVIGNNIKLDKSSSIAANVVVGDNVEIGAGVTIGPGSVIKDNVQIGQNSTLSANVTLCDGIKIGENVILHPGVVIGADGFGLAQEHGEWLKIPQIGAVQLGNNVEVGANSTIDRGAIGDTIIGNGVKIDNQVQIAHNVFIDENTAIAGCVAVAGSVTIGKRCQIGGGSCIAGHIQIADDVIITGMSGVANSIKLAGIYSSAIPITDNKVWRRNIIRFKKLDEILKNLTNKLG